MKFENMVTKYSANTPIRILISNFLPIIGPSIDIALSTYADDIYKKRVDKSLEILNKTLEHLQMESIDKKFLQSESFFDVFRLYFEKAIKTRQEKKVHYYAQLLVETIKEPNFIELSEQAVEKISALTLKDLLVVKHMYDKNSANSELFADPSNIGPGDSLSMKKIPNNLPEVEDFLGQNITKEDIELSMHNLISVGFVREFSGGAGVYRGGWYFVTPLLKEIIKKLSF